MKRLLHFKHWQIFLISWGPLATVLSLVFTHSDILIDYLQLWLVLFLVGAANSFIWIWIIAAELEKSAPQLNVRLFKIAFWIPCIYISSFVAYMLYNLFIHKVKSINARVEVNIWMSIGVLSILCIIYGLIFMGRLIKTAELGKTASLKEHLLESTLMLFPPLGLWIIQPKLNKIVARQLTTVNT